MSIAHSGTNIFGNKVKGTPINRQPSGRPWPHRSSTFLLAKGGEKFGQFLKEKRIGFVKVVTDDTDIAFGLLIRDDEDNQIRVGVRVSTPKPFNARHANDGADIRYFHEWQLLAISRDRIVERASL